MFRRPLLSGRSLRLRPLVEPEDGGLIFNWRNDLDTLYLWSVSRKLVSQRQFEDEFLNKMHQHFHCYCMVDRQRGEEDSSTIGMCYSYDASDVDGYAFICTYIVPDLTGNGLGVQATALFVDYLFTYFSLRKLYVDIFEYNELSLRTCQRAGFTIEGDFRQHHYFNGRYWDQYRLALYREGWFDLRAKLIRCLERLEQR